MPHNLNLSYGTRKALAVHVGEVAGNEIATLIQQLAAEIKELKRNKVNVTRVVPAAIEEDENQLAPQLEFEHF
ncbi:MAG: hypothetical protein KDA45_01440 [Planctomycetales bacterium]|nr:hypothetical protein [Planctomycetales bacterium]